MMNWKDIYEASNKKVEDLINSIDDKSISDSVKGVSEERKIYDYTKAYNDFCDKRRRITLRHSFLKIAAVAACVALAVVVYHVYSKPDFVPRPYVQIQPVSPQATITLANGERMPLTGVKTTIFSEDGTKIDIDTSSIKYLPKAVDTTYKKAISYNTIDIPRGGEYYIVLSDGTKVWLNSDTQLKYPVSFSGGVRKVYLQGEAFFDVVHNDDCPFIVATELGDVKVYGTLFNVQCYPDEANIKTTLEFGSVGFTAPNMAEVLLQPGFQSCYTLNSDVVEVRKVKVRDEISWKNNVFSFENKSLYDIMKILTRWYDIDVSYDSEELKNIEYSGALSKYENVNTFFNLFEASQDIRIVVSGKSVRIKKK